MPFEATIAAFAAALDAPAAAAPPQTFGREGAPDAKRFSVYRNNVAVALIGALEARYPVTRRLVGDEFFRAMARAFIAGNKPRNAIVIHYGGDFPDFIDGFEPARDIAYLADVARLENAWVESYHSAEAEPLNIAALAALDPAALANARARFHPAARLLASPYPVATIWAAHQGDGEPQPPAAWRGEEILVTRPGADVGVLVLPPHGFAFARALRDGASLAEAHGSIADDAFDSGAHLIGLIEAGALVSLAT